MQNSVVLPQRSPTTVVHKPEDPRSHILEASETIQRYDRWCDLNSGRKTDLDLLRTLGIQMFPWLC